MKIAMLLGVLFLASCAHPQTFCKLERVMDAQYYQGFCVPEGTEGYPSE